MWDFADHPWPPCRRSITRMEICSSLSIPKSTTCPSLQPCTPEGRPCSWTMMFVSDSQCVFVARYSCHQGGKDCTELFYSLHRSEVLLRPQYARLQVGVIKGQAEKFRPLPPGSLSPVPYGGQYVSMCLPNLSNSK